MYAILCTRSITRGYAKDLIVAAKEELETRIENGDTEFAYQVCQEFFGLEPDYLMELLN